MTEHHTGTSFASYRYANDLLKILGFKDISDYSTQVHYTSLDDTVIDKVNTEMERFRLLFKQRDFNLSRYGYKLSNRTQLTNFVRKVLTQLDILHEVYRKGGGNVMCLKPPNKKLEEFRMQTQELSTGSPLLFPKLHQSKDVFVVPKATKTKLMSKIMEESQSSTAVSETTIHFYRSVTLNGLCCQGLLDVITRLECSCEFSVEIGGQDVGIVTDELDMVYPLCMADYNEFKIIVDSDRLASMTVKSCGLNKLRFDYTTHKIVLDAPPFDSQFVIAHGMCASMTPKQVPPSAPVSDNVTVKDVIIHDKVYKIGCCGKKGTSYEQALAMLVELRGLATGDPTDGLKEDDKVEGVRYSMEANYSLKHLVATETGYDMYYQIPRETDVLCSLSLDSDKCIGELVAGPLRWPLDEVVNIPIVALGCGMPVAGNGLCPDILHFTPLYLVVKDVPSDRIYMFQKISVNYAGIILDTVPRNYLAINGLEWIKATGAAIS